MSRNGKPGDTVQIGYRNVRKTKRIHSQNPINRIRFALSQREGKKEWVIFRYMGKRTVQKLRNGIKPFSNRLQNGS